MLSQCRAVFLPFALANLDKRVQEKWRKKNLPFFKYCGFKSQVDLKTVTQYCVALSSWWFASSLMSNCVCVCRCLESRAPAPASRGKTPGSWREWSAARCWRGSSPWWLPSLQDTSSKVTWPTTGEIRHTTPPPFFKVMLLLILSVDTSASTLSFSLSGLNPTCPRAPEWMRPPHLNYPLNYRVRPNHLQQRTTSPRARGLGWEAEACEHSGKWKT